MLSVPKDSAITRLRKACAPTVRYWMETEVHVYGFSIAANVLLSFFPFLIVMVSLCRYVFRWPAAVDAIMFALHDYFPAEMVAFIERNVKYTVSSRGPMQIGSILLLFFTANGVFEPMEVALNRAWGISKNRSFLKNQLVSMGLIFVCGGLVLLSIVFTAMNRVMCSKLRDQLDPRDDLLQISGDSNHHIHALFGLLAAAKSQVALA